VAGTRLLSGRFPDLINSFSQTTSSLFKFTGRCLRALTNNSGGRGKTKCGMLCPRSRIQGSDRLDPKVDEEQFIEAIEKRTLEDSSSTGASNRGHFLCPPGSIRSDLDGALRIQNIR